jgi:hypothetical protein
MLDAAGVPLMACQWHACTSEVRAGCQAARLPGSQYVHCAIYLRLRVQCGSLAGACTMIMQMIMQMMIIHQAAWHLVRQHIAYIDHSTTLARSTLLGSSTTRS